MFFKKPQNIWIIAFDYILLAGLLFWTFYLVTHSPQEIVESMKARQGYLFMMLISFVGGLAIITFVSVYPTVVSFAIGGLNPIGIGISAAIGLTVANLVYYYLGFKGRNLAENASGFQKYTDYLLVWLNRGPKWFVPIFIWAYVGLTPFPNNFLTASGGLLNYPFKKTLIPLFIGNITLMTIIGHLATTGRNVFNAF